MALENATASDVHAHVHHPDFAGETRNRPDSGPKSARTPATQARVIPINRLVGQEDQPNVPTSVRRSSKNPLAGEMAAGLAAAARSAGDSEYARQPMTAVEAAKQVAPAKGEAANWLLWTAMTAAGLARLVIVGAGNLIAHCGETRTRAGVVTLIFLVAVAAGYLAGLA